VLTFTSEPFGAPVDVIGPVSIRVRARGSGPHFDVFARLCDVDPRGRSWNVCDGLVRIRDGGDWSEITVPMSATAHRFGAGHRLRVQVSGGAHPRFMRNTGTGEPPATATRLVPVDISVGGGVLSLPAAHGELPGSPSFWAGTASMIMDSPRNAGVLRTCCSIDDADMV
jgi:hypothetical protein